MIQLRLCEDGVILLVKAQPGSRESALRGEQDGALKMSVTQVAEKGKANKALIAVLSRRLGLRRAQIELLAGGTSSRKKLLIRGLSQQELHERIRAALSGR